MTAVQIRHELSEMAAVLRRPHTITTTAMMMITAAVAATGMPVSVGMQRAERGNHAAARTAAIMAKRRRHKCVRDVTGRGAYLAQ